MPKQICPEAATNIIGVISAGLCNARARNARGPQVPWCTPGPGPAASAVNAAIIAFPVRRGSEHTLISSAGQAIAWQRPGSPDTRTIPLKTSQALDLTTA